MHQGSEVAFVPGEPTDAATVSRLGLLRAGEGCVISPLAVFVPTDSQGMSRPVEIGSGCVIGPFTVIHGGVILRDHARVEEHTPLPGSRSGHSDR